MLCSAGERCHAHRDPTDCSTPGFSVLHYLPELAQVHAHCLGTVKVKVAQSCPTLCNPMEFSRPESWRGWPFPSPGHLPNPGMEPRSPPLQENSLPAEAPGEPKNPGVGSLSLLQGIFPTQGFNPGIPHCRWILYQLNYQGSPIEQKLAVTPRQTNGLLIFTILLSFTQGSCIFQHEEFIIFLSPSQARQHFSSM